MPNHCLQATRLVPEATLARYLGGNSGRINEFFIGKKKMKRNYIQIYILLFAVIVAFIFVFMDIFNDEQDHVADPNSNVDLSLSFNTTTRMFEVRNLGTEAAQFTQDVEYLLYDYDDVTEDDFVMETAPAGGTVAPGTMREFGRTYHPDWSIVMGCPEFQQSEFRPVYPPTFLARLDPTNHVPEYDESNNTARAMIPNEYRLRPDGGPNADFVPVRSTQYDWYEERKWNEDQEVVVDLHLVNVGSQPLYYCNDAHRFLWMTTYLDGVEVDGGGFGAGGIYTPPGDTFGLGNGNMAGVVPKTELDEWGFPMVEGWEPGQCHHLEIVFSWPEEVVAPESNVSNNSYAILFKDGIKYALGSNCQ